MIKPILYLRKSLEASDRQALSLDGQLRVVSAIATSRNLALAVPPLKESMSAKKPGRPLFGEMIAALHSGRADSILCWQLDRLSRNPVDAGTLMWAVSEGIIKEIITPERTYRNTPEDKLFMSFMFGMSTHYSDQLSKNIQRGNEDAMALGFWPGKPKLGYVREPGAGRKRPLLKDAARFSDLRGLCESVLDEVPVAQLFRYARNELRLSTPPGKGGHGGALINKTQFYTLFRDPFYTGVMRRKGKTYPGNHPPLVTPDEFKRMQEILDGRVNSRGRRQTRDIPYRGLLTCGRCGARLTAMWTTNRHGQKYLYYYCWKKRRGYTFCKEPSVELKKLEAQVVEQLGALAAPTHWLDAVAEIIRKDAVRDDTEGVARQAELQRQAAATRNKLARLRGLLLEERITGDEYDADRRRLVEQQVVLDGELAKQVRTKTDYLEPLGIAVSFGKTIANRLTCANDADKTEILRAVTSNMTLKAKKIAVLLKEPFRTMASLATVPGMCTRENEVQASLTKMFEDPEFQRWARHADRWDETAALSTRDLPGAQIDSNAPQCGSGSR